MKSYYLPISIIISGILIFTSITYGLSIKYAFSLDGFNLDVLQKTTNIMSSLSIFIALAAYFYSRKKDKNTLVIEQISFFRKEALLKGDEFTQFVRVTKGKDYNFSRVRLDEPTIDFVKKNHQEESQEQINIIKLPDTLPKQVQLLNILEEFALRVLYGETAKYNALNALKSPYIELVELNAIVLLQQREFISGKQTYLNVLKLYDLWKNDIDRRTPEERLEEFNANFKAPNRKS
jgi:hypothetical protein